MGDEVAMGQEFELVKASVNDIPILIEFLGDLFLLEKDFSPNPERQGLALASILDNPSHATIYLAKVNGEIAGMVVLHLCISTAEGGWCGRIEDLYIKPEFRRQGIGRMLLENLFEIASQKGLRRMSLVADKDNRPALIFYKACGFDEMNLVSFIKKFK